ncbi:carboxypeptidase-like regulatory domain-containing protein [Fibrella arboris]|uniref:carboxypeptidase-like regulatory domain-containing protein n=1 Tax=Fibrella arboris TaxID=3242486 RepID=UPI003521230C
MKLIYSIIIILSVSYNCLCQRITTGIIIDKYAKPIRFATITDVQRKHGVNSDTNGYFSFKSTDGLDTLIVSAIGYKKKRFIGNQANIRISLDEDTLQLNPIQVKRGRPDITVYGNINKRSTGSFKNCMETNLELSYQLPECDRPNSYIQKVLVYITNEVKYDSPFRIRVYTDKNDLPYQVLSNNNIIFKAYKANSWTLIDLTSYQIKIPDNQKYHVSIEWLYSDDPTEQLSYSDGRCYGIALGMSKSGREVMSSMRTNTGEWSKCNFYKLPNGNIHNPMIQVVLESFN